MRDITRFFGLIALLWLFIGAAQAQELFDLPADETPSAELAQFVPGELVVGIDPVNPKALPLQAMSFVGQVVETIPQIGAYRLVLMPSVDMETAAEFLKAIPGVQYVEPNYIYYAFATPNDPGYSQQWALPKIQANLAWDIWQPQATRYIAIIDTGIDYNHSDLRNKLRRQSDGTTVYGYNFVSNNTNANDDNGHGTHVAGIAAAEINNGIGVAGVAAWRPGLSGYNQYVQLMPVKVLDANGSGTLTAVANGITWAADNGAHVLSMSLGGGSGASTLQNAVTYAWNRGSLIVAAAGNGGSSAPQYPAYYTEVIAVAATDSSDTLTYFSQYGSWVDIAAPGASIYSTYRGNSYATLDGTSMACPHVSGAAALIWSHAANLTNQQLRSILETNVDPYNPYAGRTIGSGKGRLNVYRALQSAGGGGGTPSLSGLTISPSSVVGGNSATGTVTLTAPAPSGGFTVQLSSSNSSVASVPSSVTVPQGQTSANFTITTAQVSSTTTVTITASAGGVTRQANLTVNPPSGGVTLQSLTISPTSVWGGSSATGTVRLSGPAPSGGVVITLRSSRPDRASVPSSVTIPAGQSQANFTIRTTSGFWSGEWFTRVTITATLDSTSRSATLTIWF